MSNFDTPPAQDAQPEGIPLPVVSTDPIELRTVSPSQLKEADPENGCLRQWFFKKVGKVPEKPKPWLDKGTNIHKPLEDYLRGQPFDVEGEHYHKVIAATEYLPKPDQRLLIEYAAKIPTYENGPLLSLRMDLVNPINPDVLNIWDHKSSSDIHNNKGNHLTPETLLLDPPMMSYSHWGYFVGTHPLVSLTHFYISSTHKGRCIPPVTTIVTKQQSDDFWEGTALVQIRRMDALAKNPPHWTEVEPRKKASTCSRYGGCPYLALCTSVDPWIGVTMNSGADAGSFLAQLQALAAKGDKAYDDVPTPTAEEVAPEPETKVDYYPPGENEPVEAGDLLKQLKGEEQKTFTNAIGKTFGFEGQVGIVTAGISLLPPDAPSRMTPAAEEKPAKVKKTKVTALKNTVSRQWEYEIDRETVSATVELLNAKGADGWELVGFDGNGYVYKREVR